MNKLPYFLIFVKGIYKRCITEILSVALRNSRLETPVKSWFTVICSAKGLPCF